MYEEFFELMHTPFTRDIPADRLYSSRQIEDAMGRLTYVADRQLFAVVTADPGCGKSTLIRMFESRLAIFISLVCIMTGCGYESTQECELLTIRMYTEIHESGTFTTKKEEETYIDISYQTI